MRLHEYYFENLGGMNPLDKSGKLGSKLAEEFGGYELWEKDFRATGAMRGIGWVALYQDTSSGRLMNFWINEHDVAHPAGCNLLLIMDVFEHAFMLDYGLKRADYIAAFFKNINWAAAEATQVKRIRNDNRYCSNGPGADSAPGFYLSIFCLIFRTTFVIIILNMFSIKNRAPYDYDP
jgi:superoxide dismutase